MNVTKEELFASSEMHYTVTMPLNGKWIQAQYRRPGSLYKPEWMLDSLESYFFTWDPTAEESLYVELALMSNVL